MHIFLAGIMQGSHVASRVHDQDYRAELKQLLVRYLPRATVYDPRAEHSESLDYDDAVGRAVFFRHNQMCREIDLLVAFVPQASMGTAIEMWEAYQHGAAVLTISPLRLNWAVRFLSHAVYADLEEFEQALASGAVAATVEAVRQEGRACLPSAACDALRRNAPPN